MNPKSPRYSKSAQVGIIIGAVLILFGIIKLSEMFFGMPWWGSIRMAFGTFFSYAWPIALIGVGLYLVWAAKAGKFKNVAFDRSRPLRRSVVDKRIAGVCGGIGEFFNIDPTIVRVIAVVLLVVSPGITLITYIVGAIFIPKR